MTPMTDRSDSGSGSGSRPGRFATDSEDTPPGARLRATMAPIRLAFTWFGTRKTLTPAQRARAAQTFDAQAGALWIRKTLLDTRHPAVRAVSAVRGQIEAHWRSRTLPFPEPGIRLVRRQDLESLLAHLNVLRSELVDAVVVLDWHLELLKVEARDRLGSLYHEADYPDTLLSFFDVRWDLPNVEPPNFLRTLSPALHAQEQARVRARFEEAVALAEQAFLEEFTRLVAHLSDRITGTPDDGSPRVFRDAAVGRLQDFCARFRQWNVRSNPQLDDLVEQTRALVQGVGAPELRNRQALRAQVAESLGSVRVALEALLVNRPRRRILRQAAPPSESER